MNTPTTLGCLQENAGLPESVSRIAPAALQLEHELERVSRKLRHETEADHPLYMDETKSGQEELKVLNERLQRMNEELTARAGELERANLEWQSLLTGTSLAVMFLDRLQYVTWFTQSLADHFDFTSADLGTPFVHIASRMGCAAIAGDAAQVFKSLIPVERLIQWTDRQYLVRFQPCRTRDDFIAGIVATFTDVTSWRPEAATEDEASPRVSTGPAPQVNGRANGHSALFSDLSSESREGVPANSPSQNSNSQEAEEHFISVLSHELRNPLTPVLMGVDELGADEAFPPQLLDTLEMIRRNVENEAQLIDDLLDSTRLHNEELLAEAWPTDLHEAISRAITACQPDIVEKEQNLLISFHAAPCYVSGDLRRLEQIFRNLLNNASKFTPAGGSLSVTTRQCGNRVVVEVSDTGIGIEPGMEEKIFCRFERGREKIPGKHGGLGLGLSIARAVAEAHQGTLRAKSGGHDKGSMFIVEIPMLVYPASPA